jgi:hypothetical protein
MHTIVDPAYEHLGWRELADAPVSALRGVSEHDGEVLYQTFKVRTIGELARLRPLRCALAIAALADDSLTSADLAADEQLDNAVELTFPASDPIAVDAGPTRIDPPPGSAGHSTTH